MTEYLPVEQPLSAREEQRLAELEQVIKENFLGFVAVGSALAEIRDNRLYRTPEGRTFEQYCREIWEMSHQHADRLVSASQVIENLTPIGVKDDGTVDYDKLPKNEAQARELARLKDPEEQRQVWQRVVELQQEGKPVTARRIKNVIKAFKGEQFDNARREIEKRVEEEGTKRNGTKRSEAMQRVWREFWDQVSLERAANWRYTSRKALYSDIRTLLYAVGQADEKELREPGCALELSDREKLAQAGFRIFRMRPERLLIEEWRHGDTWVFFERCGSPKQLSDRFKDLMLDHKHLRG